MERENVRAAEREGRLEVVPLGYCLCGCGQKTTIAKYNDRKQVKGQPQQYLRGHHRRLGIGGQKRLPPETGYRIEQTGYTVAGVPSACWIWQRGLTAVGYGQIGGSSNTYGQCLAHRYFYETVIGPIPRGLDLDHLCRQKSCCNPQHLEPVTPAVNIRRGRGTKLTLEQVHLIRASDKSPKVLAEQFAVSQRCIRAILNRENWKEEKLRASA